MSEATPSPALLHAVTDSDRALWESGDSGAIARRNHAVLAALSGGWSEQDVAQAVGVRPQDVARWAGAAVAG